MTRPTDTPSDPVSAALLAADADPRLAPYLARRPAALFAGLRATSTGLLIVPLVTSLPGDPVAYQSIDPRGVTALPYGLPPGAFHAVKGDDEPEARARIYVVTSWDAGDRLTRATGHSCACAIEPGNVPAVLTYLRARFPDREILPADDADLVPAAADTLLLDDEPGDLEPEPAAALAERAARDAQPEPAAPPQPGAGYHATVRWSDLGLALAGNGAPNPNLDNAVRMIERHPDLCGRIWFDEFVLRVLTTWGQPDDAAPREWSDTDDVRLALWMQRALSVSKMSVTTARDAVAVIAGQHRRNQAVDWLRAQRWDGTPRLAALIPRGFGAAASPYTEAVGRCWLISMVARALDPGCKVDTMPVFEGAQGKRKSSALETLVGRHWFAEAAESPLSKDFFQVLQGKLLVEIAEMDAFSRAEINAVKRVLSCKVDRYRAPYGRRAEDHPRMSVFAGTTNETEYLRDATGARRFFPIACGEIDLDWLRQNRRQLFAEAVREFDQGAEWWAIPTEDARQQQEDRRVSDAWEDIIHTFLIGVPETTIGNVLQGALKIDSERWDRSNQLRVSSILKVLGWGQTIAKRGGKTVRLWTKDENSAADDIS